MKTLNITLKKKWFDMIASGEKKEEYREIKEYWCSRLLNGGTKASLKETAEAMLNPNSAALWNFNKRYYYITKVYDIVSANNGYAKNCPNIKWKHEGITIGKPNPAWCEPEDADKTVFILSIGELIKPNI